MIFIPIVSGVLFSATLKIGEIAPDFTVEDSDGKQHTLSQMVEHGPVILAFFPKAFTPGCTKEMRAYGARYPDLVKFGGQILGISADKNETLGRFKQSIEATFPMVSDESGKLLELYGIKKQFFLFNQRTTVVIDTQRKIAKIETGGDAENPDGALGAASACQLRK